MYITTFIKTNNNNLPTNYLDEVLEPVFTNVKHITIKTNPKPYEQLTTTQKDHLENVVKALLKINILIKNFYKENNDYSEYYTTFKIPKKSGGLREINAPTPEFKKMLTKIKEIFENDIKCIPHNAKFAYIKNKSTIDAIRKHQENNSNWFLKLDIKDFFPSCTPEIIYTQLKQLYPFYYLEEPQNIILKKIINICCLHGCLPQGSPVSPLLTNLIMVPFDYEINQWLKTNLFQRIVYTRYADDMLFSARQDFDWAQIEYEVQRILGETFIIKREKTRYGSKAGSNWNLGLMLNKDNNITIGHAQKKTLNAMLNNFLKDYKNNNKWAIEDIYYLQGKLSYLEQIEPEYHAYIITKYNKKYQLNYANLLKLLL